VGELFNQGTGQNPARFYYGFHYFVCFCLSWHSSSVDHFKEKLTTMFSQQEEATTI
jgi:hypothetical protein